MMTYILLRNNRESGPYSLEGLREAGLGPNDLVWVEGQSVYWLHPNEIRELKELLAAADDQQSISSHNTEMPETSTAAVASPAIEVQENPTELSANDKFAAYLPPSGKTVQAKQEVDEPAIVHPAIETRYSLPLDELKERFAKEPDRRSGKRGFMFSFPPAAKKIGLYAALLSAGLMAGIFFRKAGNKKDNNTVTPVATVAADSPPASTEPVIIQPSTDSVQDLTGVDLSLPGKKELQPGQNKAPIAMKEPPVKNDVTIKDNGTARESSEIQSAVSTVEPPVKRGAERNQPGPAIPPELVSSVTVKANDYLVGSFGGIKNLQLTVTNSSAIKLDQVIVELQYLKPRDEFLKAENIVFRSLEPGASQTVAVPKSTRGVKVRYRITRIETDAVSGNTAGN